MSPAGRTDPRAAAAWLLDQKPRHRPKSPVSTAIRYALNQWRELGRFLDDARAPLDNNASERSLRRVALDLFVGDVDASMSVAGLHTLVATCEARGINPFAYLAASFRAYRITRSAGSTNYCPVRGHALAPTPSLNR